ncbi:MAG: hypothetical protein GX131_05275 [candidate division WS1 bacterium]|jgi:hypothetical protein|nr:hypothetical protein [candidate division WS1 bacterium]
MPEASQILEGLTQAAAWGRPLALGWHIIMLAALIALLVGWRPTRRLAGTLLALPLLSVAAMAWIVGNPFNGIVFGAVAVLLIALAARLPHDTVQGGSVWTTVAGVVMVALGWTYPHFLDGAALTTYLYAAPFGLVPCPTLSGVMGFALLGDGLRNRPWSLALAVTGLFYALVSAFRLGVRLDLLMLIGVVALMVRAISASYPHAVSNRQGSHAMSADG